MTRVKGLGDYTSSMPHARSHVDACRTHTEFVFEFDARMRARTHTDTHIHAHTDGKTWLMPHANTALNKLNYLLGDPKCSFEHCSSWSICIIVCNHVFMYLYMIKKTDGET